MSRRADDACPSPISRKRAVRIATPARRGVSRTARMAILVALAVTRLAAAAPPDAADRTLALNLDGAVDVTFNVHDLALARGGSAPVYVFEEMFGGSGPALPPGLTITRVGNACIRVAWAESPPNGPFPESFSFTYSLIAGDQSQSANGTITVEQGGDPISVLTPCDTDPANTPPTTTEVTLQTAQGAPLSVMPVAIGAANDPNGNDTIRLTDEVCWANSPPSNGTVSRISDSELVYTPDAGFVGRDTFGYCVTDNPLGSEVGTSGIVTIEVQAAGAPELVDDTATTVIGQPVEIDVMANDPIGEAGAIQSVSAPLQGGTAEFIAQPGCTINTVFGTGCVRYTPPSADADGVAFVGSDSFSYVVADPNGTTAQASVVVTVEAAPGTPEANPDQVSGIVAGVPTEIDVLANDSGSTPLTIVSVGEPDHGTAEITTLADQSQVITYTADDTFAGSDTFVYTISDEDPNTIDRVGRVTIGVVAPSVLQPLEPFALNDTQRSVGAVVDTVCPALGDLQRSGTLTEGQEALLDRCSALIEFAERTQDGQAVGDALQQIAGEEVLAQGTTGTRVLNTQIRNIGSRLAALRAGVQGVSAQGLAMNFSSGTLPIGMLLNRSGAGASADEVETGGRALLADSRLGLFVNGRLNFGEQDSSPTAGGFDFDTYGLTLGADYRFRNDFVMGASAGYADSTVDFNFDSGDLQTKGWSYSLYGSWYKSNLYVDFIAGAGNADYETRRVMIFEDDRGGVDTAALGTTDGDQRLASISAGYNFQHEGWVFAPYVGYDYMKTEVGSYDEVEGAGWELSFNEQEIKSRIVTGGLRLVYNMSTNFGVFVPHLRAAFQRELEDDPVSATVHFVNDPSGTEFAFTSDVADTSFFRLGAGFSMVFQGGVSAFVDYESVQGYANLTSNTLTAGLRIERRFN